MAKRSPPAPGLACKRTLMDLTMHTNVTRSYKKRRCLVKVTRHLCFKYSKNMRPLDILPCNSANRSFFQNPTKSRFAQCSIDVQSAGPRESQPQEVKGRHYQRRSEGGNMMKAEGPQEVHSVYSRPAGRPDTSGSHSRSISDRYSPPGFCPHGF